MVNPLSFDKALAEEIKREREGLVARVENLEDSKSNMEWINRRFKEYFVGTNYDWMKTYLNLLISPYMLDMDFSSEDSRRALLQRREKAIKGIAIWKVFEEELEIKTTAVEEYAELEILYELKGIIEPVYRALVGLLGTFDIIRERDDTLIGKLFSPNQDNQ